MKREKQIKTKLTTQIPDGIRDFVPEQTRQFEFVVGQLAQVFENKGYQKVQTPTLEYFDTLAVGMGHAFDSCAVKMLDPQGRLVVLRPDHTVPIARLVVSRRQELHFPLRLYTLNPIFRYAQRDQDIETFQAGVELIGQPGFQADAEVVRLCVEALTTLGLTDFGIELGHMDHVNGLSPHQQSALLAGDYVNLGYIPNRSVEKTHPELVGIDTELTSAGIIQPILENQGLVKELGYYSGFIFDVYSFKTKQRLASGGRYDGLLGKFGWQCPAVGFAVSVEALERELRA